MGAATVDKPTVDSVDEVTAGAIFRLAAPALGVLAATPLYVLLDTAVVGRLGSLQLAGLAAATTLFSVVTTQLTFLSYGTTARAARLYGAGKRDEAIAEGVQATWVAWLVGGLLAIIMWVGAPTFTLWLAGKDDVADQATSWLRVAAAGIPLMLTTMAGNGWLRGIQNTRAPLRFTLTGVIPSAILVPILVHAFGLVGSAVANLIGLSLTAVCFLICLVRAHTGAWHPQWSVMRKQLMLGRDLIVRSLSFQLLFVTAASIAGRAGEQYLAAHQVMLQLWNFLGLVLDSLAIAAQTLTGSALGAGSVRKARTVGVTVIRYSTLFAAFLSVLFALGHNAIPRLFTGHEDVLRAMWSPWWILVVMIVVAGVVFALDGVLLGAGDAAYLRTATVASVIIGYGPAAWISAAHGGSLVGVWWGLLGFVSVRMITVVWRFRSMRWAG